MIARSLAFLSCASAVSSSAVMGTVMGWGMPMWEEPESEMAKWVPAQWLVASGL